MIYFKKYLPIFKIIRPNLSIYVFIVILSVIQGFVSGCTVLALFPILNSLLPNVQVTEGSLPGKLNFLIQLIPIKDFVVAACVLLFFVTVLNIILSVLLKYLIGVGSGKSGYLLKNKIFRMYAQTDYQFFVENKHGKLFYDLFISPPRTVILITNIAEMIALIFKISFLVLILLFLNLKFTIFVFFVVLIFNALIHLISRKISYEISKKRQSLLIQEQVIANEFLNGIKQITVYLSKPKWLRDFQQTSRFVKSLNIQEAIWLALPTNIIEFTFLLFVVTFVLLSRQSALSNAYLSSMAIYIAAVVRLLPYISNFGGLRMTISGLIPDAEATAENFIKEFPLIHSETKKFSSLEKNIRFENISFAYKDRAPVLKDLNLCFDAMKTTAIVGLSGGGKTTIINLLLKLFSPQAGKILIDDQDLKDITPDSWFSAIGFVSQDLFVFNASIKDNICFGHEKYNMDQIVAAAKIAYAHNFIQDLPQGYETNVGEKGMKLSVGQQQRIAIARAIIRNPRILFFDEPTSALDNISEELIQKALDSASQNRTVITVAHRLSTIKSANKIIVLKDGHMLEEGSHTELMVRRGQYWEMYSKMLEKH